ncbi:DUF6492 family protein [Kordiimonas pumila]|uniref:DUF6492 family protein n=1 Tax=Kordiimonas pumila TaxID=2161677 RepID=A0ABV7D975_9PROT|nr:DUF6492 family protein [Kordiimonas pumila]
MDKQFDLVTVCFGDELRLLELQARSIRLYVRPAMVANIILIINDRCFEEVQRYIEEKVYPEYGPLAALVRVFSYKDLTNGSFKKLGWRSQQALKLLAANVVEADEYVVLDCKNHFIRELKPENIWSEDGRLLASFTPVYERFRLDYINACSYFDLDPALYQATTLTSVTPFALYKSDVKDLILHMECTLRKNFVEIFMAGPRVTEFYLYYAFLIARYNTATIRYARSSRAAIALMSKQQNDYTEAKRRVELAQQKLYHTFGVHRAVFRRRDPEVLDLVFGVWQRFKLVKDLSEARYFAAAPFLRSNFFMALYNKLLKRKVLMNRG